VLLSILSPCCASAQFGEIGGQGRRPKTTKDKMDEEYEETLLMINECFVYKIPPRTSAEGYKYALLALSIAVNTEIQQQRAKDWNISNFIWSGKLIIRSKGSSCVIRLEDPNTGKAPSLISSFYITKWPGEVFAVCPVNTTGPQAVEPVIDSSRYFVLRIEDGKGTYT